MLELVTHDLSILNAIKPGTGEEMWQVMQSVLLSGQKVDYKILSHQIDNMMKIVEATHGAVSPNMLGRAYLMSRGAGTKWDENFQTGALPRLLQMINPGLGGSSGARFGPGAGFNAAMEEVEKGLTGHQLSIAAAMNLTSGVMTNRKNKLVTGDIRQKDLFLSNPDESGPDGFHAPARKDHGEKTRGQRPRRHHRQYVSQRDAAADH